ncbi:unnamed protein product [Linum trigynum]|uniref:Uncharacterized protein n=1 Tax=Linum trigynum TaxID=586398 RepID=A0AAV2G763_9ROSI
MINWLLGLTVCSGKEICLYVSDVDALEQWERDLIWDQHGGAELLDLSLVADPQSPLTKEEKRNGRAAERRSTVGSTFCLSWAADLPRLFRRPGVAAPQVARGEEKRRGKAGEEKTMKAPSRFTSIRD